MPQIELGLRKLGGNECRMLEHPCFLKHLEGKRQVFIDPRLHSRIVITVSDRIAPRFLREHIARKRQRRRKTSDNSGVDESSPSTWTPMPAFLYGIGRRHDGIGLPCRARPSSNYGDRAQ